jgi:hypothetical protein
MHCCFYLLLQKHYDFGMRALKAVLVMAGSLKRRSTNVPEEIVLIQAMRDANLPKLLSEVSSEFLHLRSSCHSHGSLCTQASVP